jgi:hypothetical protein
MSSHNLRSQGISNGFFFSFFSSFMCVGIKASLSPHNGFEYAYAVMLLQAHTHTATEQIHASQRQINSKCIRISFFEEKRIHHVYQSNAGSCFLLSSYMEYIESIGFTPKILKNFFFAQIMFLPIKSHKT